LRDAPVNLVVRRFSWNVFLLQRKSADFDSTLSLTSLLRMDRWGRGAGCFFKSQDKTQDKTQEAGQAGQAGRAACIRKGSSRKRRGGMGWDRRGFEVLVKHLVALEL
jgi:hypothetical protein